MIETRLSLRLCGETALIEGFLYFLSYIEKCYSICYNRAVEVSVLSFDEIVREIRQQLGITQEQFARELNISFSTINRWENAHTVPSRLAKMRLVEFCEKRNISSDIVERLNTL